MVEICGLNVVLYYHDLVYFLNIVKTVNTPH